MSFNLFCIVQDFNNLLKTHLKHFKLFKLKINLSTYVVYFIYIFVYNSIKTLIDYRIHNDKI